MALGIHKSVDRGNEFTCIRTLGRTRVVISRMEGSGDSSHLKMTSRQYCRRREHLEAPNRFESLPQDVLVRIVCGVDHSDLEQLSKVSKMFREAALIAKKSHFAFTTPKPIYGDMNLIDIEKALNAPKQPRIYKSLAGTVLRSLTERLFQ